MHLSRIKYVIVSLFVLALIAWLIEGLIAAETIRFSAYRVTEILRSLVESLKYLVLLAFFAVAAGALAISIINRRMLIEVFKRMIRGSEDEDSQSTWKNLLAWIVSFTAFLLILWFFASGGTGILNFPLFDSGETSSNNSGAVSETPPPNGAIATVSPFMSTLLLVSGLLIGATTVAAGLLFFQALREAREEEDYSAPLSAEESLRGQALNVMGETIAEIKAYEEASDFRSAIIKCYQRLCELLAQYNCKIQKHETAREFRIHASRLLKIPDEPFLKLTDLFEEARYSTHEIDEVKRGEALKCLELIRGYLAGENDA